MSNHAPLAPSAIARWMGCPGSVKAEATLERRSSRYAEEGTAAHTIYAAALLTNLPVATLAGGAAPDIIAAIDIAVVATRDIIRGRPFAVEQRLPPLPDEPFVWGTADICVFDRRRRWVEDLIDFKFGAYVLVEADAPQLGAYSVLAGAYHGASPDGIGAHVVQPRAYHSAGIARSHFYAPGELVAFETKMRQAAQAVRAPNAPRRAGSWCMFCAAKETCETQRDYVRVSFGVNRSRDLVIEAG